MNSPIVITPGLAVDPMYLVLPGDVYGRVAEWLHPHEPKIADIRVVFRSMSEQDKKVALSRAKTLIEYGKAVVKVAEEESE